MYSNMLYMKTRVTFRVAEDLADALKELPNQTHFVEQALRVALGRTCPLCDGTGRIARAGVRVSNLRRAGLAPLTRSAALQLKQVVAIASELAASSVDLSAGDEPDALRFVVRRGSQTLLSGKLSSAERDWSVS